MAPCQNLASNLWRPASTHSAKTVVELLSIFALAIKQVKQGLALLIIPSPSNLKNATPLIPSLPSFQDNHRAFVNLEEAMGSLSDYSRVPLTCLYTFSTNAVLGEGIGLVCPKVLTGIRCS